MPMSQCSPRSGPVPKTVLSGGAYDSRMTRQVSKKKPKSMKRLLRMPW